jgi:hypothetical protein
MNHINASAGGLCFPFESGETMTNITVRLLNNIRQILAKKVPVFGQASKITFPLIGQKCTRMIVNFMNKFS